MSATYVGKRLSRLYVGMWDFQCGDFDHRFTVAFGCSLLGLRPYRLAYKFGDLVSLGAWILHRVAERLGVSPLHRLAVLVCLGSKPISLMPSPLPSIRAGKAYCLKVVRRLIMAAS